MLNTPSVTISVLAYWPWSPEYLLQRGHIAVRVDAPGGLGKPDAVDDRGVVQLIADHQVAVVQERAEHRRVGGEAALEHQCRLGMFELASWRSSSSWIAIVPMIVRTAPDPTPSSSIARWPPRVASGGWSGPGSYSTRG